MKFFLQSGESFDGKSVGADVPMEGEVVFTTGMSGYLEILTDPSYFGQIVVFTFPLIGNYGVFEKENIFQDIDRIFESEKVWVRGVVVSHISDEYSHCLARKHFNDWMKSQNIPVIEGVDTRSVTKILREKGCVLGAIAKQKPAKFSDPLAGRYVPEVSPEEMTILEPSIKTQKTIAFIDCGAKNGIIREFLSRGIRLLRFPYNVDPFETDHAFDGIFFSNGPGDPETLPEVVAIMEKSLDANIPIFGICLGNQILAIAAGGKTKKMKYGHRGINQPCQEIGTEKCIITAQNHGYVVDDAAIPQDFEVWFRNLNDQSIEGIRHKTKSIFSVQFHPEACAGTHDARYLFDEFLNIL